MKQLTTILLFALCFAACQNTTESDTSTAEKTTEAAPSDEWTILFDGTSTEGWRAYNGETLPPQWIIEDDMLTFSDGAKQSDAEHEGGKDIIYAAEEFENFELYLEWKIPEGGNSGVFYHAKEGYESPYEVAPEYQMIDDENYAKLHDLVAYNKSLGHPNPEQLQPLQQTAADYAMYVADDEVKELNPAGEWNTTRIIFTPEQVEHWLNGKKVLSFVPWSDDWNERKNNGKWKDFPDYGKFKKGYIGLQDHDSPLWFKNIKVKKL
ncbi:MAG: DUF1080 domain-containing protein [Bacteroidota bacterium]